jgi:hypothetical protein
VLVKLTLRILGGQQGTPQRGEHVGDRDGVLVAVPGRAGAVGGKVVGGLASCILPSRTETRSARPTSPPPRAGSAPPTPSSRTSSTSSCPTRQTSTQARWAPLCLATLASASLTMSQVAASTGSGGRSGRSTSSSTGTGQRSTSPARGRCQPAVGQHLRMDAMDEIPQLRQDPLDSSCALSTRRRAAGGASASSSRASPAS